MLNHLNKFLFGLLGICLWTSCSLNYLQKPNILIIAVENLGSNDVNCSREPKPMAKSGFDLLCKNSVRFTHAYTPSLLSLPSLSTLVSGLYPFEHGVHNNGPDFLKVNFPNVAKSAYLNGYRTSFISGGPPALRSGGLQQGFETFEDNLSPTIKKIFRPADVSFTLFSNWSKEADSAFLAMIYVPDLLLTNRETLDEFGEKRNLTRESQIENLDLNLSILFARMKKDKIWDQSNIILVGLNGPISENNTDQYPELNLHSENTQIALLIKSASKPRDEGLSWTYDEPVTLADLGRTIFDWLGDSATVTSKMPVYSLAESLKKPASTRVNDRWIYSESYWGAWRKKSGPMYSLRKNNILYIQDSRDHFYNTLTDRQESSELPLSDSMVTSLLSELSVVKQLVGMPVQPNASPNEDIKDLRQIVQNYLLQSNWKELRSLGLKNHEPDWVALSERNLGITKTEFTDPCLHLIDLSRPSQQDRRLCTDRRTLMLSDYIRSSFENQNDLIDQHSKDYFRKKIFQILRDEALFSQLESTNFIVNEIWNISEHRKLDHFNFDLAMHHPKVSKLHLSSQ